MKANKIAEIARKEIVALTGLQVDTISSIAHKEDKWVVTIDMIELRMIPNTQDVLATYEIELSENNTDGLLGYRRMNRYRRDQLAAAYG